MPGGPFQPTHPGDIAPAVSHPSTAGGTVLVEALPPDRTLQFSDGLHEHGHLRVATLAHEATVHEVHVPSLSSLDGGTTFLLAITTGAAAGVLRRRRR